ncbi:hypothetical protein GGR55DRAFT_289850 [Xylaria sp. FL0064]|nr:hypothetical protein GGR55DRAFT_289850 [Xylaria sp. FL0064]
MAAAAPRPRAVGGGLTFMQNLSPRVYLWRPSSPDNNTNNDTTTRAAVDPALIIVFGWMNAADGPLAKYVRQHQQLFPSSAILLITCTFAGMTLPWLGLREARIAAITARAILEHGEDEVRHRESSSSSSPPPRLLLHVFSNAGSTMLYHLYTAFAATTANNTTTAAATGSSSSSNDAPKEAMQALPLHATIFDSAPAPFTYQTLMRGIFDGAPSRAIRLAVTPVAYLYVALVWFVLTVLRVPDHIGDLAPRAHNDVVGAQRGEACRVYVYGPADRITPVAEVRRHADEAEARGFRVRREVFERTGHVAHARGDAERYWRVVQQIWEEARALGEMPGARL